MVYCRRCGTHLNDGAKFCPKCGTLYRDYTSINPNKKEITIGRSTSCDISLGESAEYASTYHGTIFWNGTQLMYKDTSSNGTVINNMMVHGKTVPINHGDTILVADKYQITWEKIDSLLAPSSMSYQPTRLLKLNTVTSCRKCGTKLNVGSKYCHKCGTPCNSFSSQSAGESGVVEQKKSSKVPIKALLSVIIVIALLCGGWFVWKSLGNDYSLEGLAKACVKYDWVYDFHEGLAKVGKAYKFGYIDRNGEEVIPCVFELPDYEEDFNFHDGLALFSKDNKLYYINKKGEEAFPLDWEGGSHFSEGLASVGNESEHGYIDTKGNTVFTLSKSEYSSVGSFSEGLAAVYNGDKWGFIDSKGVLIIPMVYEKEVGMEAPMFHDGLARVKKDGKWGYIDKTGSEVIPFIFDGASDFSEGLASVYNKDFKHGYIDKTGNEVIPYMYNIALNFKDGLARVKKDGGWGFIDKSGKEVVSCIYEYVLDFSDGLAPVEKDGKWGIIDTTGSEVIPFIFDRASDFSEGLACVEKDGYWGYVDLHGNSTFDIDNEEVKNLVQKKQKEIEEKKREEERKREEENKPCNRFYSIVNQNQFVWEARKHYLGVPGIDVLYFYPISKTEGYVSITRQAPDYESWYPTHSLKTNYRILGDNSITFSASGVGGLGRRPWSTQYNMTIENYGDEIRLVNHVNFYGDNKTIIYSQKNKPIKDPL